MPDRVILIAAVTIDGYVAKDNLEKIEWSRDLGLFKEQTMGWPIIMGSNTLKTLPGELEGRETWVVGRKDDPEEILREIKSKQCFIIGGGRTYHRFINHITHIYVTPHPHVFGSGIPLFDGLVTRELSLKFQKLIEIDGGLGIFQYQYKVNKP